MADLVVRPFLLRTARLRAAWVHDVGSCGDECSMCLGVALRHAQSLTDKLRRHLDDGPPCTAGEPVRDWVTILQWVSDPEAGRTPIDRIRSCLTRRMSPEEPTFALVMAVAAQFGVAQNTAAARRRQLDALIDARRSYLAQEQGWAVRPLRDFRTRAKLHHLAALHPAGASVFEEVLHRLENGEPHAYERAVAAADARALPDLEALVAALLDEEATREWYLSNVERRIAFNESATRELPTDPLDLHACLGG